MTGCFSKFTTDVSGIRLQQIAFLRGYCKGVHAETDRTAKNRKYGNKICCNQQNRKAFG